MLRTNDHIQTGLLARMHAESRDRDARTSGATETTALLSPSPLTVNCQPNPVEDVATPFPYAGANNLLAFIYFLIRMVLFTFYIMIFLRLGMLHDVNEHGNRDDYACLNDASVNDCGYYENLGNELGNPFYGQTAITLVTFFVSLMSSILMACLQGLSAYRRHAHHIQLMMEIILGLIGATYAYLEKGAQIGFDFLCHRQACGLATDIEYFAPNYEPGVYLFIILAVWINVLSIIYFIIDRCIAPNLREIPTPLQSVVIEGDRGPVAEASEEEIPENPLEARLSRVGVSEFPSKYTCVLTQTIMHDPQRLFPCEHSVEGGYWLDNLLKSREPQCPSDRIPIIGTEPNPVLRAEIERFVKEREKAHKHAKLFEHREGIQKPWEYEDVALEECQSLGETEHVPDSRPWEYEDLDDYKIRLKH